MRRILLFLGLAVLCGCGVGTGTRPATDGPGKSPAVTGPMALIGQPLPDFTAEDAHGSIRNADFKGKVLLLDFWGLRFAPCLAAAPVLEHFHREYGPAGLVVLGINSQKDSSARIREYVEEHNYTYRSAWQCGNLVHACDVHNLPTFVVVDRTGIVRAVFFGPNNLENNLIESIRPLLGS